MEAIILAGGFGKRLQSVVRDVPKPMADINGRPFLSYLMDYLMFYGVGKVLLSVGYKHEVIKGHFGMKYKSMDIGYVTEEEPLGTGGAIRDALSHASGENVIVLNGDSLFAVDLKGMVDFHISKGAILTLALKPMRNFNRYGTVVVEGERVTGFEEKAFREFGYINGGVYVMNREIAGLFSKYGNSFSIETDFFQEKAERMRPYAFISDAYFIDIGIPEEYERAKRELEGVLLREA